MTAPPVRLSVQELTAAGRSVPLPFELELLREDTAVESSETVLATEILRVLPQRRIVLRIDWAGREAVLKLFLGRGASRYRDREIHGLECLAAGGATLPEVYARVVAGSTCGIVFEYLSGSTPVAEWDSRGVLAVVRLFGKLHARGVRQKDLHLDNFLIRGETLFAIDGDGVKAQSSALSEQAGMEDLAGLLVQRSPFLDGEIPGLVDAYCDVSGWRSDEAWLARLDGWIKRQRRRRVSKYLNKTLRDCSEFVVSRSWKEQIVKIRSASEPDLMAIVDDPEGAVASSRVLKAGNSATVVRYCSPDTPQSPGSTSYVIKRYNIKNFTHGLQRAITPHPRFKRAWCNGHRLHFLGIPTSRPLALVVRRNRPWQTIAYLVMEDLGDLHLAAEVRDQGLSEARCKEVVQLFVALGRTELTHGDTKSTNFIVHNDTVHLIDLDSMQQGSDGQGKDLRRFMENFTTDVAVAFEAAFRKSGLL